jgi:hypothetical protein
VLDALIDPRDGVADEVTRAVAEERADVGILIVDRTPDGFGFARVLSVPLTKGGSRDEAYALVSRDGLTRNSLAHEVGHLLGCSHEWETRSASPLFPWGRGHVLRGGTGASYRTLMATGGNRLGLVSDPTREHRGARLGVPRGESLHADCVDAMRRAAAVVSNYRVRAPVPPRVPADGTK